VKTGDDKRIPILPEALEEMNVRHVDYILPTHIHLDHAGGLGFLLKHYPGARAICHRKGIPHLIEPAKLWEASKKVLGDIADLYGELVPVPEGNIDFKSDIPAGAPPLLFMKHRATQHIISPTRSETCSLSVRRWGYIIRWRRIYIYVSPLHRALIFVIT